MFAGCGYAAGALSSLEHADNENKVIVEANNKAVTFFMIIILML